MPQITSRRLRAAFVAVALVLSALPMSSVSAAPSTTHAVDPSTPRTANGWYRGPVKVTLDGGADAVRTEYRIDGGAWETYKGTQVLFDGTEATFDRWKMAPGGSFQLLPDGTMLTRGGLGMLWYPREFGDAELNFEWRDVNPTGQGQDNTLKAYGNSGVFARFPNPEEIAATPAEQRPACATEENRLAWIAIRCGQEFQIYDGKTGEVQKTGSVYNFKPLTLEQAKPDGDMDADWNTYGLRVVGGGDYTATVTRNGEVINEYTNSPGQISSRAGDPPTEQRQFATGYIGLQNHGNSDLIQFRNVSVDILSPLPITIAQQGRHTLEYRSVDAAGVVEEATSVALNIDYGAPQTSARLEPAQPGAGGTYTGPVTVALDAADGDGEVDKTEYRVDGGAWQTYVAETTLFDGTADSLARWRQAGPGSFTLTNDGTLLTTGGMGMLWYPEQEFGDAALKLEFREARTDGGFSNSGVFMRFPDPTSTQACEPPGRDEWVAIGCGHEIQLYDGPTGEVQKTGSIYNFKPTNLQQAKPTPAGEWNTYEVRTVGGGDYTITVLRNGEVINTFTNSPNQRSSRFQDPPTNLRQFAQGFIGLQNHGGSDLMEFRNIRVEDLTPDAAAFTVAGAGAHTVEFRSTDAAGHVEPIRSVSFTIAG